MHLVVNLQFARPTTGRVTGTNWPRSRTLRQVTDTHRQVAAYWAAAEARDWDVFGSLIAADVVYEAPQTRERVRGWDAYLRFNTEGFPGDDWHLAVERIVAEGRFAASWIRMTDRDGSQPGLCFFEFDAEGLIAKITDFWPEPAELPASRAHLVERY